MLLYSKEKQARIAAEKQREEDRRRFEVERAEYLRCFDAQLQKERRRAEEIHQALLAAIVALTDKVAALPGPGRQNQ